jgi:hypothetical protein
MFWSDMGHVILGGCRRIAYPTMCGVSGFVNRASYTDTGFVDVINIWMESLDATQDRLCILAMIVDNTSAIL